MDHMPQKDMQWAIDGIAIPLYQGELHWYIVGEKYTYQVCISIAVKEEPDTARHKFYTEFDVVPAYSSKHDMLIKVSNALNIQMKDKVVIKNFKLQLKNARVKWIEI